MKKKIFSLCAILALLFVLFFPKGSKVAASDEAPTEDSIISSDYHNSGDRSKWQYIPQYATVIQSTLVYENQKIYVLLYDISYNTPFNRHPEDYILKHYIRTADGNVFWYPDVDRGVLLNDWSDVNSNYDPPLHRTFALEPYEISGAAPLKPNITFSNTDNYGVVATFSGKADTNKTVFYYDYYSVKKNTGGMSYIADEGTEGNATDYMTGFFYKIDTNPSDISLDGSWTRVDSGDHTGATKSLSTSVPQSAVSSDTTYYMHVVSQSYTGKLSATATTEIPHRGNHTLKYNTAGGSANFPAQRKHYGSYLRIYDSIPKMRAYTFKGWVSADNNVYQPGNSYDRDQENGDYILNALWEMNKYHLHFDKNNKNEKNDITMTNGTITGDMPDVTLRYDATGLPENHFVNTTKQADGQDQYSFMGWSTDKNASKPIINSSYSEPDQWKNYPISTLVDSLGLTDSPDSTITLYAVWDKAPEVSSVQDIYISKQEIEKGITPSLLMRNLVINDYEDGIIRPSDSASSDIEYFLPALAGNNSGNIMDPGSSSFAAKGNIPKNALDTVRLVNFRSSDLNISGDRGGLSLTALAVDKAYNTTVISYMIHIYDASPLVASDGGSEEYVRFIDSDNIKKSEDNGGLSLRSIWKIDNNYKKSIESALSSKYKSTRSFSAEDIQNAAIEIKENGLGHYDSFARKFMY